MPALAGHLMRFSWGGKMYGADQWTNTLHFDSPGTDQPDPAVIRQALQTFQGFVMGGCSIDWWKYNEINPATGKYASSESHTYEVNPALQGAQSSHPPQLSLALTLRTGVARGPANSGRIFLPYAPNVSNAGVLVQADQDALLTVAKSFLSDVIASKTHLLVVWSAQSRVVQPVRTLQMGRVIDTQRRRRASLTENYRSLALTG